MVGEVPLGARMHCAGLVVKGRATDWIDVMTGITKAIGMNVIGDPVVRDYPVDGKGGVGTTIFVTITESFLALDTWPDHDGAYLFVCSCRPFYTKDIDSEIAKHGLRVESKDNRRFYRELQLK